MRRRPRKQYTPSSGHRLAKLIESFLPRPFESEAHKNSRPARIRKHLTSDSFSPRVANLAGIAGADWAIAQLSAPPHVVIGWPRACKAARMRLPNRKAVSK